MARLIRRIEDLVVEDGEIQGKTKTDGMRGSKVSLSDFGGILVGLKRFVGRSLAFVAKSEFGQIAVVVSFPKSKRTLAS